MNEKFCCSDIFSLVLAEPAQFVYVLAEVLTKEMGKVVERKVLDENNCCIKKSEFKYFRIINFYYLAVSL